MACRCSFSSDRVLGRCGQTHSHSGSRNQQMTATHVGRKETGNTAHILRRPLLPAWPLARQCTLTTTSTGAPQLTSGCMGDILARVGMAAGVEVLETPCREEMPVGGCCSATLPACTGQPHIMQHLPTPHAQQTDCMPRAASSSCMSDATMLQQPQLAIAPRQWPPCAPTCAQAITSCVPQNHVSNSAAFLQTRSSERSLPPRGLHTPGDEGGRDGGHAGFRGSMECKFQVQAAAGTARL